MRLTDTAVRALPVPPKGAKIYVCDQLDGFGVRVSQAGTKAFVLTYGKERERVTIGRYPLIGLADARIAAKRILAERMLGKNRPKRLRGSEALDRFMVEQREKNRPITARYTEALIRNHFAKLLDKNLEDIQTDDVTSVTDKLLKKEQSGAAAHSFTAVRTFLRWCVKRRYIQHSPVEALDLPSKAQSRDRVLSDDELRLVWKAAETIGGNFGKITQLLILTGQRRSEIGSLQTSWCSLMPGTTSKPVQGAVGEHYQRAGEQKRVTADGEPPPLAPSHQSAPENTDCELTIAEPQNGSALSTHGVGGKTPHSAFISSQASICIPKEITKNKRAHTFPIGELASAILKTRLQESANAFLFPARPIARNEHFTIQPSSAFNGWSKAKAQLDKKMDEIRDKAGDKMAPWTLHDLRRTYATNLQRLGIKLEVIEALLNHVSGTRAGIVGVYNRWSYDPEMKEAVDKYETWLKTVIE